MITIGHSASNSGALVLPPRTATATPDTDAPTTTPTIEPTKPDIQPEPDVEPAPDDEPVEPPAFEPREDPDSDPRPTCPEGEPDEGDGEFETCRLPERFSPRG